MCLRVLLNSSEYLDEEAKKESIEFFLKRMQASGYKQLFRYEILKSAIQAYDTIKGDTTRTLYRSKAMNTPARRAQGRDKKRKWYKTGNSESVLFVQATKNSELAKNVREVISSSNINIRVVEKAGTKVKRKLQRNNPFKERECKDERCFVCTTTRKGNCRKPGVTYDVRCEGDCGEDVYNGETFKNTFGRGKEHLDDYEKKRSKSVMWKHCLKKHDGIPQRFNMRVVDSPRRDPMMRQILEAMHINELPENKRMNDKKEWNIGKLPVFEVTE